MKDMKSLVKELSETMERASIDLEAVSWKTRPSLQNMKMDAERSATLLKTEYFKRVRSNSLGLFLFGEPERVAAFTKIVAEDEDVQTINGAELYEKLAAKVEPSFGANREFGPTQLQGLIEGLRALNLTMGVRDMVMPKLKEISIMKTPEDTVRYVRSLVQGAVQDDLLRLNLDQKINETALSAKFAGTVFAVAITGLDPAEIPALVPIFTHAVTVDVGTSTDGEINKEFVMQQLKSLRPHAKTQSPTN